MTNVAQAAGTEKTEVRGRRFFPYLLALLLLLNAGARGARLESDSPPLPNEFRNVSPYKDEGEKAHEARNRARFGQWQTSPLDDFRFWHVQSPVWTWTLFAVFKTLGVSYASLRLWSIFCALVTLGLGSWWLHRAGFRTGALLFPILLGLNFYYLIHTRLGLMEPMLIAWLALAALFLARSRRHPASLIPAALFLAAAIFTKQSALLFLPVGAGYLLAQARKPKTERHPQAAILLAASALVLVVPIAVAYSFPAYRNLTTINLTHGFHLTREVQQQPLLPTLTNLFHSFAPAQLWRGFFMMLPASSLLGLGWIGSLIWRVVKRRPVSDLEWLLLAWLVIGRGAAVATSHQVVRFHLFYFFPLTMMAALAGDRMWRAASEASGRLGESIPLRKKFCFRGIVIVLILYELLMTAVPWWAWVSHPRYDLVDGSRRLGEVLQTEEELMGRTPVVIGEWAGPLSLENRMICHYVKAYYNQRPDQLRAFGITHLLENLDKDDPAVNRFQRLFPQTYAARQPVADFQVRNRHLRLWRIPPILPE